MTRRIPATRRQADKQPSRLADKRTHCGVFDSEPWVDIEYPRVDVGSGGRRGVGSDLGEENVRIVEGSLLSAFHPNKPVVHDAHHRFGVEWQCPSRHVEGAIEFNNQIFRLFLYRHYGKFFRV